MRKLRLTKIKSQNLKLIWDKFLNIILWIGEARSVGWSIPLLVVIGLFTESFTILVLIGIIIVVSVSLNTKVDQEIAKAIFHLKQEPQEELEPRETEKFTVEEVNDL